MNNAKQSLKSFARYPDGEINLDSELGKEIGFTSDLFQGGWLWKTGTTITLSFIHVKHQGHGRLKTLIKTILDKGITVEIPTPIGKMEHFVKEYALPMKVIYNNIMGPVEVYVFTPDRKHLLNQNRLHIPAFHINPLAQRAHQFVKRKVKLKDACEICGSGEWLIGHHPDYNNPLEVITLCNPCHKKVHSL
jgi:hypothetical protein